MVSGAPGATPWGNFTPPTLKSRLRVRFSAAGQPSWEVAASAGWTPIRPAPATPRPAMPAPRRNPRRPRWWSVDVGAGVESPWSVHIGRLLAVGVTRRPTREPSQPREAATRQDFLH